MSNGDKIKKRLPFQGCVRAEDRDIFHKQVITKIAYWKDNNSDLEGTFSERCLTTKLIELFKQKGITSKVLENPEPSMVMVDKIPGVDECIVEQDGRAHVKIRFEGRTMSEFEHRQSRVEKFLDDNGIPHQGLCLFVCLTGQREMELSGEFMEKLEKARKRG